jgi:subtilisin family serine protease
MRTAVTTFLAGLLAITMAVPAGADDLAAIDAAETTSDWIVTLVDGTRSRQVAPGLARLAGGEVGFVFDKVLGGFSFTGSPRAAAALRQNPMVASVVAGGTFELQEVQTGVSRISGDDLHSFGGGAYRGSGVRVAVIDSGIDLDHPDLVANIDGSAGINCVTPGASPDDDNSHGTHVAGIIGASLNGTGVVGVAPEATLVPVKAFDAGGNATTAQVLCGINYVAGLAEDGVPTVANMSFGEAGSDSTCDDGDTSDAIHEAVCDLVDKGVIAVAAAGNNSGSAEEFIPAVFDEVISVSALTDLDGAPGGLGGCLLIFIFCDDEFAYFSNFGPSVDVIAPGDPILSTVPGGGYGEKSGTSMAAPHVSGVVAAMLSADPALTRSAAQALLQTSGECPSGATNSGGPTCGTEIWPGDPDGVGEPLVNALRAVELTVATAGGSGNIPPIVSFDRSCTELTCDFVDTSWEPDGTIVSWAWDFGDGGTSDLPNPTHTFGAEGTYSVVLTVTDNDGATGTGTRDVTVPSLFGPGVQGEGDWVGVYGADGYGLAAWNSGSDLVVSDRMTVSLEQGSRHSWASPTTDGRALESPDQAERRAAAWYSSSEVRLSLGFADAFAGDLHLYSVDWDGDARRQTLIVDDGNVTGRGFTSRSVSLRVVRLRSGQSTTARRMRCFPA